MTKIRVLIVDDHGVVRQGLRTYLELLDDITVIGEARNGREAVAQVRQHAPDVVLMDISMPERDCLAAWKEILALNPDAKVAMFSSLGEKILLLQAIRAGAKDYIVKPVEKERVIGVIHKMLGLTL